MKNKKSVDKAKNFKPTLKKIIKYIGEYKKSLLVIVFFSILSTTFSIIGPNILGDATTEIFEGLVKKITGTGGIDFDLIKNTLFVLLILYIFSTVCSFIQEFIMNNVGIKISFELRQQISEKLHKLPLSYFETRTNGEILSRITNDVDTLSTNLTQTLTRAVTSVATIIGALIMMFSISGSLTIASILVLPLSLFGMSFIMKHSQKYFTKQQENLGKVNGIVEETYSGHDVVKVFNKEKVYIDKFNDLNKELFESGWKSQFLSTSMHPLISFIGNINYVLVSLYGGFLVIKEKIQVGDILSFSQYIRNLNQSVGNMAQVFSYMQPTVAAAERIFEFLESEEEIENHVLSNVSGLNGNIEFKNVNFGYTSDKTIINDFSLKVKKGQKIAIVGPTGAGKTTLVKLLMRFYDINSGSIKIDNTDITTLNRQDLRSMFGMVLQDTWLYTGTIEENIKYGKLDATLEDVKEAARKASVHHFIKTQPDGYNMFLNEESDNISSGQKQLLTIARVILADPKILILDEATSSVDTRTEILIQSAMDKLMEGRTSFIIAHRLSTIKNADMILVMDKGDIVETGSHKELLKKGGFYANLYNSQFEEEEI